MSFDLAIAVKRDPGKGAGPKPVIALAKTLVFEASGALSHDGAAALAEAIDEAVSPEFRDYIVRFQSITDVDNDALQMFAQWMRGRQDKGIDIRLSEVASALMPLDQATNDTARRIVDVRSNRREVPTDEPESTSSSISRTTTTTKHGS